ncbi:family 2A encapsulin nanocompartment shell protein [Allorhizocola rhizosphaerae]|uniref:family 2A encapsulin nanocompartment shell protein n=1 Tax=Allorhizocola rhizosphaerae TaxID=1872709 RepID=UPI000E3D308D|nr:family 2A encapsulin nanocompartment shell protein [Allorhizocola rhizosphaerae]
MSVPVSSEEIQAQRALGHLSARQLTHTTKSVAQLPIISPRWLLQMLPWVPVEAGVYRVNQVRNPEAIEISDPEQAEVELAETFVDYEPAPREYFVRNLSSSLAVNTRVADLHRRPYDQMEEQLRLVVEALKERQERDIITHPDYGMLASVADAQRLSTLDGPPTPDDLDQLITKVWKKPAFFLTHPLAVAAFGRECTRRGVPPATVSIDGVQFITWRGIPIVPSDKVPVADGKTSFLLLRTGEKRQGVIGLYQSGVDGERGPGLSVRLMSIDRQAIATYLVSLYFSLAVMTDDALAVLDDVEIDKFHTYPFSYR